MTIGLLLLPPMIGCDVPNKDAARSPITGQNFRPHSESTNGSVPPTQLASDAASYVRQAEQAAFEGDLIRTRKLLNKALIADPKQPEALFRSAQLNANEGQLEVAIEQLRQIPSTQEKFGNPAFLLAVEWTMASGNITDAAALHEQRFEETPNSPVVRHEYARFLHLIGRRQLAAKLIAPLIKAASATEEELRAMSDRSVPFSQNQPPGLVRANPRLGRLGSLDRARQSWKQKRPRDALRTIERYLTENPNEIEAIALRMAILVDLQRYREAASSLRLASPSTRGQLKGQPLYWIAVGDLWRASDAETAALAAYFQGLHLDPTNQPLHQRLAASFAKLGNPGMANHFDNRRYLILDLCVAVKKISQGLPEDLRSGLTAATVLEQLGLIEQAINWLTILAVRHGEKARSTLENQIERLRRIPADQISRIRYGDFQVDSIKPTPVTENPFFKLALPTEQQTKQNSFHSQNNTVAMNDVSATLGIDHAFLNSSTRRKGDRLIHQQLGGGAAVLDYDIDGHPDLYLAQGGCEISDPLMTGPIESSGQPNALLRHLGDRFQDVAKSASCDDRQYSMGVTSGDWNQDGFPDLVVGNLGTNMLFLNQGDGTFVTAWVPDDWPRRSFTTGLAIADLDSDGLSDLVEINYLDDPDAFQHRQSPNGTTIEFPMPLMFRAGENRIWSSNPAGKIQTQKRFIPNGTRQSRGTRSEIGHSNQPSLGLLVGNLDGRPGVEVFVANDLRPNQMWMRDTSTGNWNDVAVLNGTAFSVRGELNACMGVASCDFDHNGLLDLLVTNFSGEWNNLFTQMRPGVFRDLAAQYRFDSVSEPVLGFGAQALDFENDGLSDLIVANGYLDEIPGTMNSYRMPTQLIRNRGDHFALVDPATLDQRPSSYWHQNHVGRCVVTLDHNTDGRTDALVTDLEDNTALLENQTHHSNHFLQVKLVGRDSHRDAIGSVVTVATAQRSQTAWLTSGDGYMGRNESILAFGLGSDADTVEISVQWPDGQIETFGRLLPDRRYLIVEGTKEAWICHHGT